MLCHLWYRDRLVAQYHTSTSNSTYDTTEGQSITAGLQKLWGTYDLSYLYGTAPQDYTLSRCAGTICLLTDPLVLTLPKRPVPLEWLCSLSAHL